MDLDEVFDAAIMAKKKKKKKNFDLDVALGISEPSDANKAEKQQTEAPTVGAAYEELNVDSLDFENFGKKKKKKKKAINLDELSSDMGALNLKLQPAGECNDSASIDNVPAEDDFNLDMDFSMTKKKKKHKKKDLDDLFGTGASSSVTACSSAEKLQTSGGNQSLDDEGLVFELEEDAECGASAWANSDRDYTYDELLKRAFDVMYEKNPDLAAGRKAKFIMRPPQVLRIGTKKTSFANFLDIAKTLHRIPKHLMDFVLAELGTSGSMDGNQQLIIKGRFQPKQIENVLRRYIKEYVTCHTCRSPETVLQKDTRLYFLQCEVCGSRCSVATIKSGFQAITSKRAAIRARYS